MVYADPSFLLAAYLPEPESEKALRWMARSGEALAFTPLQRHEFRTGVRYRVFRGLMTHNDCIAVFSELEADLDDNTLVHVPIPWTDAFREAEQLGSRHVEKLGVRSIDLLHIGTALAFKATEFLTFDSRQLALAKAAGLRIGP